MPYIKEQRRNELGSSGIAETTGELNYLITQRLTDYLISKGESYQTYNDIMGALEGAKQEIYRRKIIPYEDKKMKENGDVFIV